MLGQSLSLLAGGKGLGSSPILQQTPNVHVRNLISINFLFYFLFNNITPAAFKWGKKKNTNASNSSVLGMN